MLKGVCITRARACSYSLVLETAGPFGAVSYAVPSSRLRLYPAHMLLVCSRCGIAQARDKAGLSKRRADANTGSVKESWRLKETRDGDHQLRPRTDHPGRVGAGVSQARSPPIICPILHTDYNTNFRITVTQPRSYSKPPLSLDCNTFLRLHTKSVVVNMVCSSSPQPHISIPTIARQRFSTSNLFFWSFSSQYAHQHTHTMSFQV